MWESLRLPVDGNSLLRKIAPFLTAIIAIIVGFLLTTAGAHALEGGWGENNTIVVNGANHAASTDIYPGIPAGSITYAHKSTDGRSGSVVYFPQGADIEHANSAQYVLFTINPPNQWTNPRGQESVNVAPKSGAQPRTDAVTGDQGPLGENRSGEATSCAIQGIGWLVCPVTRYIASGMDKIFDLIKTFFEVKTITLDTEGPTYRMWDVMRGLANLCFIVAFLVIIYSQITSYGISNYEIKKMIPKLVVAAILVNVSYYICAVAVDLSNILGNSLQQAFVDMRGQIVGPNTPANTAVTSWESVTTFILSGGAIAAAGITSLGIAVAAGASILSLTVVLVPFLLGAVFAVIVALLILAARQALIVILITISPLAFVAMLLPSTEKWFDRWRGTLTTMLVMFPMFAVVFGGSQLAGGLIIQSADSIMMLLIGMAVQVAPLVITPLLIRLSGNLLGKVAGMVNNRQKGFIDRTRNALGENDKRRRNRRIAEGHEQMANGARPFSAGMTKRWASRRNAVKHTKEADDKAYQAFTSAQGDAHWKERLFHEDNTGSQTVFNPNGQRRRRLNSVRNAYASTYGYQSQSEMLDAFDKRSKEEAKAGNGNNFYGQYGRITDAHGQNNVQIQNAVNSAALETHLDNQAAQSASRLHNREVSAKLEDVVDGHNLRVRAAGIDEQYGQARAMASAIQARVNDRSEGLKNIELMIDVRNPDAMHLHQLALGYDVPELNIKSNDEIVEVAIKKIASSGNVQGINELGRVLDLSETSNDFWRTAFVDSLKSNSSRPRYFSAGLLDKMSQGLPGGFGDKGMQDAIIKALEANAYDAKGMLSDDKTTLELVNILLRTPRANLPPINDAKVSDNLRAAIHNIARDPEARGSIGKRKEAIMDIARYVGINPDILENGEPPVSPEEPNQ